MTPTPADAPLRSSSHSPTAGQPSLAAASAKEQFVLFRRPIRWSAPRQDELARHAAELVEKGRVSFTLHALEERIGERDIDEKEALEVIRLGTPYQAEPGIAEGEWRVNISRRIRGRDAAVAVSLVQGRPEAKVLTVMWRDRHR